ncbi:MAG: D-alanyl-D-alanine carboxypeptidase family protein [Acidimicrobiia bacterium]
MTIAAVLLAVLALSPQARPRQLPPLPIQHLFTPAPPDLDAPSWALHAVDEDVELVAHNGDVRRPMASLTKIMTALVMVENSSPAEPVTISSKAAATGAGYAGPVRLREGQVWTVGELLAKLLVESANDAGVALAEHVAGSEDAFIDAMNLRAVELGLNDTRFANPPGLDADGHFSTARDLVTLTTVAIQDPIISRTLRVRATVFRPDPSQEPFRAGSTNRLLGTFPGVLGGKTGDTRAAGKVLISFADTGNVRLVGVVLGAEDHFGAMRRLLAYGFTAFGPKDHFYATGRGEESVALLPDWLQARLAAPRPLDDGQWAQSPPGGTPLERLIADRLLDLIPESLGGRP